MTIVHLEAHVSDWKIIVEEAMLDEFSKEAFELRDWNTKRSVKHNLLFLGMALDWCTNMNTRSNALKEFAKIHFCSSPPALLVHRSFSFQKFIHNKQRNTLKSRKHVRMIICRWNTVLIDRKGIFDSLSSAGIAYENVTFTLLQDNVRTEGTDEFYDEKGVSKRTTISN